MLGYARENLKMPMLMLRIENRSKGDKNHMHVPNPNCKKKGPEKVQHDPKVKEEEC